MLLAYRGLSQLYGVKEQGFLQTFYVCFRLKLPQVTIL